ncbi:MAG: hypothetical protein ACOYNS_17665 [Bacteroidota bacterium]
MKQRTFFLVLFLLGISAASATIRVVDGVGASGSGRFAKISDAVTTAVTNDTIVVLPGIYREVDVSIDKKLTVLGSGYRDVKNGGTHLQGFNLGIADAADGTRIQGFRFIGGGVVFGTTTDNCLIANNYFSNAQVYFGSGHTGDTIRNNIFVMTSAVSAITTVYNGAFTNIVIANNIFSGSGQAAGINAFYIRIAPANMNNVQIINNFIEKYYYFYGNDWAHQSGMIIAGNIFHKITTISPYASAALLYSGNWKLNLTVGIAEPTGGTDNGNGDITSLFTRFDQGFDFKDNPSTDTDFRLKSSTTPYPDSPIDGSAPAIAPLGSWYVDFLQQPGTSNSNRADGGIFGGPYPFGSSYGAPLLPAVSNLSVSPAVTAPNGTIQINATGSVIGYPGRNN